MHLASNRNKRRVSAVWSRAALLPNPRSADVRRCLVACWWPRGGDRGGHRHLGEWRQQRPSQGPQRAGQERLHAVATLLKGIPQTGTTLGTQGAGDDRLLRRPRVPICRLFTLGSTAAASRSSSPTRSARGSQGLYKSFARHCTNHGQSTFNLQQVAAYPRPAEPVLGYAELFYREQQSNLGLTSTPPS